MVWLPAGGWRYNAYLHTLNGISPIPNSYRLDGKIYSDIKLSNAVSLISVLQFITGLMTIPPMGFDWTPTITFSHKQLKMTLSLLLTLAIWPSAFQQQSWTKPTFPHLACVISLVLVQFNCQTFAFIHISAMLALNNNITNHLSKLEFR